MPGTVKISELPVTTTMGGGDIFPITKDPTGTPATKQISLTNSETALFGDALSTLATTSKQIIGAINELVALIASITGGSTVTSQQLKDWAQGEAYEILNLDPDDDGVMKTANILWPDGSAGVLTTTLKNAPWLQVDAYNVTHVASGKTVTQAAVTRNIIGVITVKPALTVA